MDKKAFGLKLAQVRQSKNITAYELALRINRANNYIHLVEAGKLNISIESIFRICNQLQIKPEILFHGMEPDPETW